MIGRWVLLLGLPLWRFGPTDVLERERIPLERRGEHPEHQPREIWPGRRRLSLDRAVGAGRWSSTNAQNTRDLSESAHLMSLVVPPSAT
jgi:hypothetical protein